MVWRLPDYWSEWGWQLSILSPNFGGLLAFTGSFPSKINISRANVGTDVLGGESRPELWPNLYAGISASIQEASPKEVMEFGQRQIQMSHNIFFRRPPSYATIVELGDRVVDQRGSLYTVQATMDFHGGSPMIRLAVMYRGAADIGVLGVSGINSFVGGPCTRIIFAPPAGVTLVSGSAATVLPWLQSNLVVNASNVATGLDIPGGIPFTNLTITTGASPSITCLSGLQVQAPISLPDTATFAGANIPGLIWSNGASTIANTVYTPW